MAEYKFKCSNCGLIITTANQFFPDPKMNGSCAKAANGNHSWIIA